MDTKSFVKILRKVVREEVQKAVKQILSEQKTSHKQVIDHGVRLSRIAENPTNPYSPTAKKKTFSKNSMLNDILNETAATADFGNMQEGPMVSMDAEMQSSNFASMMNSQRGVNVTPTVDAEGRPVNVNNLPEHVTSALTKDYSALMKAIDKKKGISR